MSDTICHHLLRRRRTSGNQRAYQTKIKGSWHSFTWNQFYDQVSQTYRGLLASGIQPGDKVVIFSQTRPEWTIADYAILSLGAISVPVYQSSHPEEIAFILKHSDAKFVFCENKKLLRRLELAEQHEPTIKSIPRVLFESFSKSDQDLQGLMLQGSKREDSLDEAIQKRNLDELATIVYTSGTTGQPKGALLSHEQIMSEVGEVFDYVGTCDTDITLTFLPFAHILGRIEQWGFVYHGFCLSYAESIEKIVHNLKEVRPTVMVAVPRIFEKIYNGIQAKIENKPSRRALFKWAESIGLSYSTEKAKKGSPSVRVRLQYALADKLIFSNVRAALGGRLRFVVSGGAPLSRDLGQFFHACGLLVLEGYGLTETTAAICVNKPGDFEFGTVGRPFGDVEIKIAADGEILVCSRKVFRGYFKSPEVTADVMENDFFKTGDIGEFTPEGRLKITDRKKDLIKTAGGKYVAPQKLENHLRLNPYVSQALIHGDQRKFIVALITLDRETCQNHLREIGRSVGNLEELAKTDEIRRLVQKSVREINKSLSSFETIKKFKILPVEFTVDSGELTPSLKLKRKYCDQKYKDDIEELYGEDKGGFDL